MDSKKRISDSNKKDVRKREAFTLPSTEKRNSVKPVTSKAADPDFIFKEERLQMYHKSSLDIVKNHFTLILCYVPIHYCPYF